MNWTIAILLGVVLWIALIAGGILLWSAVAPVSQATHPSNSVSGGTAQPTSRPSASVATARANGAL